MLKKIYSDIDHRSKDERELKFVYRIQLLSVGIFLPIAFKLYFKQDELIWSLFFLFEALGQLFLGINNYRNYLNKYNKVTYFQKNKLGLIAGIFFSLVILLRFILIGNALESNHFSLYILAIIFSLFPYYFFFKQRSDVHFGNTIIISSLLLGIAFAYTNLIYMALPHILYGLMVLVGALFLKPKTAEFINIPIWIYLYTQIY